MNVKIMDYCIRCGMCVDLCPSCFAFNFEEDRIDVLPAAQTADPAALRQMALDCAVGSISLRQDD